MRLPGVDRAFVSVPKLRDYLLSESHSVGRFKAAFFGSLGYTPEAWQELEAELRRHALENDAALGVSGPYGQKYLISGTIGGPAGRGAVLVSVWIVLEGEDFPRFVTAFPGSRS